MVYSSGGRAETRAEVSGFKRVITLILIQLTTQIPTKGGILCIGLLTNIIFTNHVLTCHIVKILKYMLNGLVWASMLKTIKPFSKYPKNQST